MANADDKHTAMWNWLYQCPELSDLFFTFSQNKNGSAVLVPMAKEKAVKTFLDGSTINHYDFMLVLYKEINADTPNNTENVDVMVDVEKCMDWIETQNKDRNFPLFPTGCTVQRVENIQNMPTVAGQDESGAKYMFACRVIYKKGV
jgi:hypothetical protein